MQNKTQNTRTHKCRHVHAHTFQLAPRLIYRKNSIKFNDLSRSYIGIFYSQLQMGLYQSFKPQTGEVQRLPIEATKKTSDNFPVG